MHKIAMIGDVVDDGRKAEVSLGQIPISKRLRERKLSGVKAGS